MQRSVAAIYFVFFLVVGAAAYTYIGVAQDTQQPQFALDGATFDGNGSTNTIGGTQYTATEIGTETSSGGEGGGITKRIATVEWTNESAVHRASLDNNSTTTHQNTTYTVVVANESNVSSFTLREKQNVSKILAADPAVQNTLATHNGTKQVVYRENNSLRPLSEYLSAPETQEFSIGDTYQYEGNATNIASVTGSGVTLEWTAPKGESATDIKENTNVTLANGQQYFVHFPSDGTVQLVPGEQYGQYVHTVSERNYFHERTNGLWGVTIISGMAAILILSMAYLPRRS